MKKSFSLSTEYKLKVRASAYIGKKGYTIPKIALQKEDIENGEPHRVMHSLVGTFIKEMPAEES